MKKIAVWGDSILKGAVTGLNPDHLFDIIEDNSLALAQKSLGFELHNDSVFGGIITKSQKRMNRYFEKGNTCDIAIIESGGNDSDYDWIQLAKNENSAPLPRTPLADFMRILDEMVTAAKSHGATPLLMTMPSLVADRWYHHITRDLGEDGKLTVTKFLCGNATQQTSRTQGETPTPQTTSETEVSTTTNGNPISQEEVSIAIDRLSKNHEVYNLNIIEYAHKNNIAIVDMRKALLETPNYRDLMCLDGIHPNVEGYKFMATVWEKELPKVLQ